MKTYAFYLPQYYPIPENDKFWGKGFTEWRNVAAAKPLFKGHEQPRIPTDLGFYDLRNVDTIREQIKAAKEIGIDGFKFWHYWFGNGIQALEKPAKAFLENKDLDIEISFAWVNYEWTKSWVGKDSEIIFEQVYSLDDYKKHFDYLLPFFEDSRYTRIDGKPLFSILKPNQIPSMEFFDMFETLAQKNGLNGIAWNAPLVNTSDELQSKFDYLFGFPPGDAWMGLDQKTKRLEKLGLTKGPRKVDYVKFLDSCISNSKKAYDKLGSKYIPTFMPNWDNTPRYKKKGFLYTNNTPENMHKLFDGLYQLGKENKSKFILIKAWNEWAEGNYIEPDMLYGNEIGNAIASVLNTSK